MSDHSESRQLVVFTLGAEHYALPIQQVHEIIRYAQPRSVASRADWVRGVISLRGRIVPVYDLAAHLGVTSELSEQTKIVIVETESETAGVIVDDVEEVLTIEDEQIEEAADRPSRSCAAVRRGVGLLPVSRRTRSGLPCGGRIRPRSEAGRRREPRRFREQPDIEGAAGGRVRQRR